MLSPSVLKIVEPFVFILITSCETGYGDMLYWQYKIKWIELFGG